MMGMTKKEGIPVRDTFFAYILVFVFIMKTT